MKRLTHFKSSKIKLPILMLAGLAVLATLTCNLFTPQDATSTPTERVLIETVVVVVTPTETTPVPPTQPVASPTPLELEVDPVFTPTQPPPSPTPLVLVVVPIEGPSDILDGKFLFPDYTGGATSELVFQVLARNPEAGEHDGAGVSNVEFIIFDQNGQEVHRRTENLAGYCAFGGGEPDCNVWRFAERDFKWPSGLDIQSGIHTLVATINMQDDDFWEGQITFEIKLP